MCTMQFWCVKRQPRFLKKDTGRLCSPGRSIAHFGLAAVFCVRVNRHRDVSVLLMLFFCHSVSRCRYVPADVSRGPVDPRTAAPRLGADQRAFLFAVKVSQSANPFKCRLLLRQAPSIFLSGKSRVSIWASVRLSSKFWPTYIGSPSTP